MIFYELPHLNKSLIVFDNEMLYEPYETSKIELIRTINKIIKLYKDDTNHFKPSLRL